MLNPSKKSPVHKFYVSDYTDAFEKSTRYFFSEAIRLQEARIWKITIRFILSYPVSVALRPYHAVISYIPV